MRLAWRNLSHDRLRFVVTVMGIAFVTFLLDFFCRTCFFCEIMYHL
jgi:hypothetical protein